MVMPKCSHNTVYEFLTTFNGFNRKSRLQHRVLNRIRWDQRVPQRPVVCWSAFSLPFLRSFILLGCISIALGGQSACGQGIESLRGLSGVRVKVDLSEEVTRDGLTLSQVTADVELSLQQAGVPLLSQEKWRSSPGRPFLQVWVESAKIQDNWKFYTYSIQLHLVQDVSLIRMNPLDRFSAVTWYRSLTGHGYLGDIRVRVKEAVEAFAAAYSTANPQ
jgi:hypothetical protein